MSLMYLLLIIWGVITTILVILIIYRSTLTMHEDEQLFLDDSSSHMEAEQKELLVKVNRITPIVGWLALLLESLSLSSPGCGYGRACQCSNETSASGPCPLRTSLLLLAISVEDRSQR